MRSGETGERQLSGHPPTSLHCSRTDGNARRNARRCSSLWPREGRGTGSTGPRRPRIMEGPLVSDTAELLDAPSAAEGSPVGRVEGSKSRGRSGTGLSSLLMPELQRLAQELGIPGTGRMRKSQLVEAIEARQGSQSPRKQDSDQRGTSAGAGATRPLKQDQMELDTFSRTGVGASVEHGLGDGGAGGLGATAVSAVQSGADQSGAVQSASVQSASERAASGRSASGRSAAGRAAAARTAVEAGAAQAGAGPWPCSAVIAAPVRWCAGRDGRPRRT